ncbi:tryptophan synthase beta subunit-like PLP-dependent enzyme [Dichotomopilus funicola]|uniref:Tryptophan synthase beta subunit-like PLP-dependent enzyme n=1 Tax=Dichotomopilus funicola TaxID=1934379 RepID=A0AAN6V471_9PEZI|nr:tryptophan synthase beta subunit-like PLP-dependent enzyme [Dichotomopilus funicola]
MTPPNPFIHFNPTAKTWRFTHQRDNTNPPQDTKVSPTSTSAQTFHQHLLPSYTPTPLHSLPSLANDLGISHLLLKDESSRFGLPSFKILGASWATYRAVLDKLGISEQDGPDNNPTTPPPHGVGEGGSHHHFLASLGTLAQQRGFTSLRLVTCTAGNWGRAVARMARYMGLAATVYVPRHVAESTRELIRGEGAEVVVVEGDYDDAVDETKRAVEGDGSGGSVLVMDIAWEGYEVVPQWVVAGYQTMLDESDAQVLTATGGRLATHAMVPVGCGSIAQAVTKHYKDANRTQPTTVIAVEPDTAACLKASLENGKMTTVPTGNSIMCGMNCGTLSTIAWPILASGVDAAVAVEDMESHDMAQAIEALGGNAGPCGASTLAGLKKGYETDRERLGLTKESVVVLFCTEGARQYELPAE